MASVVGVRKLVLTMHVASSIGWMGAVAGFLALALAALAHPAVEEMRGAYYSMDLVTRFVIVPSCIASLLTGIVQSLITPWGLFRHYWVLLKLLLTLGATLVLVLHTQPIRSAAGVTDPLTLTSTEFRGTGIQLAADSGAGIAVLLVITVLGVYKPRGMTAYGQRTSAVIKPGT